MAGAAAAPHPEGFEPEARTRLSRRPVRVLFDILTATKALWGGLEEHLCTLGRHLAARGYQPSIVLRAPYPLEKSRRWEAAGLRLVTAPGLMATHPWLPPLKEWAPPLWRLLRRERIDVYHMHSILEGNEVRAAVVARAAGVPAIVCSYQMLPSFWGNDSRKRRLGMRWLHRVLGVRGIACSSAVRDMIQERYAPPTGYLTRVFIGIDDLRPDGLPPRPRAGTPVTLGVLARLSREKGVDVLLDALAVVDPALAVRAVIIGEGDELPALQEQARTLGLAERVDFRGFVPDAAQLLPEFDVIVIPSRTEGLPLVGIEACAAGRPIVATKVGGLLDLVRDGDNGRLVPSDDAVAMAGAIEAIARDPDRRAQMGKAGRNLFEAQFRAETMVDQITRIYESALPLDGP